MKALVLGFLFAIAASGAAQAQKKHSKKPVEKTPVFNYVIDDPMDRVPAPQVGALVIALPDFVILSPVHRGDTTYRYELYDGQNRKLRADTLTDFAMVRTLSLFREHMDEAHTYTTNGVERPLPISRIVYRYDRTATDRWMSIDYATNKMANLKEMPDVTRTDTTIMPGNRLRVNRYYKTIQVQ